MVQMEMPPVMTAPGLLANETICYSGTMVTTNGVFAKEDPMAYSIPILFFQVTFIVLTTRLLTLLLKPLNMPRVFCELIGGIILGPSAMGWLFTWMRSYIFGANTLVLLETVANIGILYFVFMIGLEMDFSIIRKHGKRAIAFASAGTLLPFLTGIAFALFLHNKALPMREDTFLIFFSVALSVTALPIVAHILPELRLQDTEIGKIAKSIALINEAFGLILIVVGTCLAESQTPLKSSVWIILSSIVFVVFCVLVVRPAISWLERHSAPKEESFKDLMIPVTLAGVMILGFTTDSIGVDPIFGAFVFGLVFTKGTLQVTLVEKLEDFVMGFLVPLFFVTVGFKTNVSKIQGGSTWVTLILATLLSSVGKVAGTVFVALFIKMPFREGVALGLLMNSKGLIHLIGLNHGRDQKVISDTAYAIMVVMTIFMNGIIKSILLTVYRPARKFAPYKRRTVQRTNVDADFRILACVHTPRNVPTIISLLEASYPTKKSPLSVFSLHLVELTGHGSSILIAHNTRKSERPFISKLQAQSDHILNAFETFGQHTTSVFVRSFTSISPYSTMHEEISDLAEDKRAALIIVPFHKQPTIDGGMEAPNPNIQMLNRNLLEKAPCSVGILVDRGLNSDSKINQVSQNIAVLFFGGPDDREALSYGLRMSEHPRNTLSVICFLPGPEALENITIDPSHDHNVHGILTLDIMKETEKQLDNDYTRELRLMKANDESFSYIEKVVNNGEETVAAIKSMGNIHDLFIVGRGEGTVSQLTAGLTEWSECPELGVIGDMLAAADFAATMSVFVVQQYVGVDPLVGGIGLPETAGQYEDRNF